MTSSHTTADRLTQLNKAFLKIRPAIVIAMVFSLFINLLALVSPLYMLQVYDRVLSGRNELTLLFITLIAVFLLLVYAALEALRTQVLVRAGIKFDSDVRARIFRGALSATIQNRPGGVQAFRDMGVVREFLTGAGLISFCDAPWTPVFIVIAFILHPFFGILAIISCVTILGLAMANDYATRAPLQQATIASISAQNDASATMRNSEVMQAMGMWSGLQNRWELKRNDVIGWQALASDRGGGLMSGIKGFRQIVQTLILGGGAYLAIKGSLSPGAMIAASVIVGRALAPIELAVGQWKGFVAARGAWDRLQLVLRGDSEDETRMLLPSPTGQLSVELATIVPPGRKKPAVLGATLHSSRRDGAGGDRPERGRQVQPGARTGRRLADGRRSRPPRWLRPEAVGSRTIGFVRRLSAAGRGAVLWHRRGEYRPIWSAALRRPDRSRPAGRRA